MLTAQILMMCLGFSYPDHIRVKSRSDLDCYPGHRVIQVTGSSRSAVVTQFQCWYMFLYVCYSMLDDVAVLFVSTRGTASTALFVESNLQPDFFASWDQPCGTAQVQHRECM